jgi:hypothetical protein
LPSFITSIVQDAQSLPQSKEEDPVSWFGLGIHVDIGEEQQEEDMVLEMPTTNGVGGGEAAAWFW